MTPKALFQVMPRSYSDFDMLLYDTAKEQVRGMIQLCKPKLKYIASALAIKPQRLRRLIEELDLSDYFEQRKAEYKEKIALQRKQEKTRTDGQAS